MARTNKYTSLNFNDIYEKKIINPNNTNSNNSNTSKSSSFSSHKSYSLSASSCIHGNMLVLSRPSPKPQHPPQINHHPSQINQHPLSQNLTPPPQIQNQQFPQLHKVTQPSSQAQNQQFPILQKVNQHQHPHPQGENHQFPQLLKVNQQHPQPQNQQNKQLPASIQSAPMSKPADSDSISLRPQGKTGGTPSFQESKVDAGAAKGNKFVPPHLRPGFVAREASPPVPDFQRPKQGNYRPSSAHGTYHGSPNRFAEDGRPKTGGGYERRMRTTGPGSGPVESNMVVLNRPRSGGSRPSSS